MTQQEQQTINKLYDILKDIRSENKIHKEQIDIQVSKLAEQVNEKHLPLNLESKLVYTINDTLQQSILKVLTDGYSNPLRPYITAVIDDYGPSIKDKIKSVLDTELSSDVFDKTLKNELVSKIVRNIIKGLDGSVDKVVNELKQDSTFKAELVLLVNKFTKNYIK